MEPVAAIPIVRNAVVAVFRYRQTRPQTTKKGKVRPAAFSVGWGSGFGLVRDRFIATAFHNLNGGKPRDPADHFLAFLVPGNGGAAHNFPITGFPLERPDLDLAVLEIGPSSAPDVHIESLPVSFAPLQDGARVLTVGFPAPEVLGLNIDPQGNYHGGQFFLKSHANEGILSAQYALGPVGVYEFNVGWHHGESGGPVVRLDEPLAVFTMMQHYRNVTGPHGTMAGPHRGVSLAAIQVDLRQLGAQVV